MSDTNKTENMPPSTLALTDSLRTPKITQAQAAMPLTINSSSSTPTIAAGSMSRLRAPTNFSGISGSFTKIGRICSHSAPKAGPPPRDHGAVLTQDTEQFIIGQKVWVGGIRPGQIAYIGETHFAPGEWAGIVLDEPNGKNDGCVAGKRYFQCEPRRGIFSRLTRLTLTPLTGMHTPTSPITKMSPDRSRTVSPTISLRSPGKNGFTVGDRIIVSSGFGSRPGILRYLGETRFASGNWCGVELDEPSGKNDGSVDGVMYFECKPNYGIFVPIAKVSLSPSSKRTRLSKRGSRESLNSIGTINSTATTNTSRLRSNAQRIPLSIKPVVATPKSQYSVQDILAEKQKHIEQLMIERELDREDTQNQALQYQKNINELKSRVIQLERVLDDERKKSEDLQFSIDEATYCGSDTQVYKEKIQDLERKVSELSIENNSAVDATVSAKTSELRLQLQQQKSDYEGQLATVEEEVKQLQANIDCLRKENATLQKELIDKDESLEKISLSACGIENLRHELELLSEEAEKHRQQLQADFTLKLEEKALLLHNLKSELTAQKNSLTTLESERSNIEDECQILRVECKNRDTELLNVHEQLAKLKAELSLQQAENATLEELLKTQQTGMVEGKAQLAEKLQEIEKLSTDNSNLQSVKELLESKLNAITEELSKSTELQQSCEEKLRIAASVDQENLVAMTQQGMAMEMLKKQMTELTIENENLKAKLQQLKQTSADATAAAEALRISCEEKEMLYTDNVIELKQVNAKLEAQLECEQQQTQQTLNAKVKEIETLNSEVDRLQQRVRTLECDSCVEQLNLKIKQFEMRIKSLEEDVVSKEKALTAKTDAYAQQERLLAEKVESLSSTTAALHTTNNLVNKLKQELDSACVRCAQLEVTTKEQDAHFAQQQFQIGDMTRKVDALNAKCDSLTAQNETLKQDVRGARANVTELQIEIRKLKDELAARQKTLLETQTNSNDERLRLESQLEEQKQNLCNALKALQEAHEQHQSTRDELAKKNELLNMLEEKTIKQELTLSDAQRQQENLQSKCDMLVAQNKSLQNDTNTLRTTSTDSNAELLKLTQEIAAKQKDYDELLDRSNAERAALESQLQASAQRVDTLCNQVETLTQEMKCTIEVSVNRLETLKLEQKKCGRQELELGDLSRKLEAISAKCTTLENNNETLQNDLAAARNASAESNAAIAKLTEELTEKQKLLEHLQIDNRLEEFQRRLQTSQQDVDCLRAELQAALEANAAQLGQFESIKSELQNQTAQQLDEMKQKAAAERQEIIETFEAQLTVAEQTKAKLDEAISSLQQQIQLLQDELLKSQLDFKSKEEELLKQLSNLEDEATKLRAALQEVQAEGSSTLSEVQLEKAELQQMVEKLQTELKTYESQLLVCSGEIEQLQLSQTNVLADTTKLYEQLKTLETELELAKAEIEYKEKMAESDKQKMEELRHMAESVQGVNAQISATNAELSEALHALEQEKSEAAHIFELYEMESDHNMEALTGKLTDTEQQLHDVKAELQQESTKLNESQTAFENVGAKLEASETAMASMQSSLMEQATQIIMLKSANVELRKIIEEKDQAIQQQTELERQLNEYKNIIREIDDVTAKKNVELNQLEERVKVSQETNLYQLEAYKSLEVEYASLQRKFQMLEMEKMREIVTLKGRINDLQVTSKLKQNGSTAGGDCVPKESEENDDNTAQINFLNSIIADMQKKNDTLKAKIETLEALPTDYTQTKAFELIGQRKPAPRVFCDICDEFDKHETEECPLQASDDHEYSPSPLTAPRNEKERKLPEPRKYCETCEVFGHDTGECDYDECY